MVLTHPSRKDKDEAFMVHVDEVPCYLAANTYRLVDGKAVTKKALMVAQLRTSDTHPSFRVQCLPEDVEKAIAMVVSKCREQCAKNGAAQRVMEEVFAKTPTVVRKGYRD